MARQRYAALRSGLRGIGIQRTALFMQLHEAVVSSGARLVTGAKVTAANPEHGTLVLADGGAQGPFDLMLDALGVRSPLSSTTF